MTTTATEIRERLNSLAPLNRGQVTAESLAHQQAVEAQLAYARMLTGGTPLRPEDIAIFHGCFGTALALRALAGVDPARADEVAAQVMDGWEGGDYAVGWLRTSLGRDTREISDLSYRLAEAAGSSKKPTTSPRPEEYPGQGTLW